MQTQASNKSAFLRGEKAGIWLALLVALGLHMLLLLLPGIKKNQDIADNSSQIEVQLIKTISQVPVLPDPEPEPAANPTPASLEPAAKPQQPLFDAVVQAPLPTPEPDPLTAINRDFESLNLSEKQQLASTVLAAQFMTETPISEQIFGKQLESEIADPQRNFHFPERQNILAMLDQPMPRVPFAYTPNLIHFAYDPGVKGDLQRFWDVITPEFDWITNNGTEFKCVWVLVIAACGWK